MPTNKVVIVAEQKESITFLKSFFRRKTAYAPCFIDKAELYPACVSRRPALFTITEAALLQDVVQKTTKTPVLCLLPADFRKGLDAAITHNIKYFMRTPYDKQELEYKIESMLIEHDTLRQMQTYIQELGTIAEVSQLVSSTLDSREIFFRTVKKIADTMSVARCSIIRVDWLHKNAYVISSHEDPNLPMLKLRLRKYPELTQALRSKKPVVISDVKIDPIMKRVKDVLTPLGIRSIMVVPIIFRENVIGTLFLRTSRSARTFGQSEIQLVMTIANSVANALYNAFLFEQLEDEKTRLEKLSITDFLTGIYNVRYFSNRIIEEFSRSQRYGDSICCMMVDIDHFKKVNDVYGHKTGDRVLKEVAQTLRKYSRRSDVVARYGGEEFIILLPQTPLAGGIAEANSLIELIRGHRFKTLKHKEGITVSIGLSCYPHPKIVSHDTLISSADDALFNAKKSGRNRVVVFGS